MQSAQPRPDTQQALNKWLLHKSRAVSQKLCFSGKWMSEGRGTVSRVLLYCPLSSPSPRCPPPHWLVRRRSKGDEDAPLGSVTPQPSAQGLGSESQSRSLIHSANAGTASSARGSLRALCPAPHPAGSCPSCPQLKMGPQTQDIHWSGPLDSPTPSRMPPLAPKEEGITPGQPSEP